MRTKTLAGLTAMLCLLLVSSASASVARYFPTSEPGPEQSFEVKGTGETTFSTGKVSIKCGEATYTGKTPPKSGSTTQTVLPVYKNCKTSESMEAVVSNEHCSLAFYGQELISPGVFAEFTGYVNSGGTCHLKYAIKVLGETVCEVIVQSQKELKGSEQTDLKPAGITIKAALTGIVYKVTPTCESLGIKGGTEGTATGTAKTNALFIE
jgi:hypothetical protein